MFGGIQGTDNLAPPLFGPQQLGPNYAGFQVAETYPIDKT